MSSEKFAIIRYTAMKLWIISNVLNNICDIKKIKSQSRTKKVRISYTSTNVPEKNSNY